MRQSFVVKAKRCGAVACLSLHFKVIRSVNRCGLLAYELRLAACSNAASLDDACTPETGGPFMTVMPAIPGDAND